ncbi:MAG: plasmid pRiA4b ORF-3 family protein [Candidatus Dormibacteraeota bacterium]|jgi:hypothetical protein|nr:plasmid pRiA4b ORF-3 family protein [Candidatus Dormibacteraeota bacterium]
MPQSLRYRLLVTLDGVEPPIARELDVPGNVSLAGLHTILQIAMGWQDYHMHSFEAMEKSFGAPDPELNTVDERGVQLLTVAPSTGSLVTYEYDFGDSWRHLIEVVAITPGDPGPPICLAGSRSCPPEDCGGPYGYQDLLAALADPSHPEHAELSTWAGPFDPEHFDLTAVNRGLSRLRP